MMNRRSVCGISLAAGIALNILVASMAAAGTPAAQEGKITVFVAKKIITMDPSWPEGTAVAVRNGEILSVGRNLEDLKPWLSRHPHVIDERFKDKILTPGFVESHGHPTLGGMEYNLPLVSHLPMGQSYGKDLPGVKNAEEGMVLIKKYLAEQTDPNKPLLVFGWDLIAMGVELDKTILDKISPTHPLAVWDASAHQTFVNSAFIKHQKMTDDLAQKLPGARVGADGHLNGKFQSVSASAHVLLPLLADALTLENNAAPDILTETLWPWWDSGFNIYVHSNGTGGNDATMNSLAELQARKFRLDHRFAFQHYGMSREEHSRRMKTLGGMASVNPYYVYYRSEFNADGMGTDVAQTAARLKSLTSAGVPVTLHSDSPMGPARPLEWAWIAANHPTIKSNNIMAPAERVTVDQAMRMITIEAAFHLGMESKIGSIEAGKFADFTFLEQDPYSVDPMKIRDTPIWGTVLAGKPQAVADIVTVKGLKYMDYGKLMADLSLTPEEKFALHSLTRVRSEDLPDYASDAYTTHGLRDMLSLNMGGKKAH